MNQAQRERLERERLERERLEREARAGDHDAARRLSSLATRRGDSMTAACATFLLGDPAPLIGRLVDAWQRDDERALRRFERCLCLFGLDKAVLQALDTALHMGQPYAQTNRMERADVLCALLSALVSPHRQAVVLHEMAGQGPSSLCYAIRGSIGVCVGVGRCSETYPTPGSWWPALRPWQRELEANIARGMSWARTPEPDRVIVRFTSDAPDLLPALLQAPAQSEAARRLSRALDRREQPSSAASRRHLNLDVRELRQAQALRELEEGPLHLGPDDGGEEDTPLRSWPWLETLTIKGPVVASEQRARRWAFMPALREVTLVTCSASEQGLEQLLDQARAPRLEVVTLERCDLTGLRALSAASPELRRLRIQGGQLSAGAAHALASWSGLARLEWLEIGARGLRDEDLRPLLTSPDLTNLRCLWLNTSAVTPRLIEQLCASPALASLRALVIGTHVQRDAASSAAALINATFAGSLRLLRVQRRATEGPAAHQRLLGALQGSPLAHVLYDGLLPDDVLEAATADALD